MRLNRALPWTHFYGQAIRDSQLVEVILSHGYIFKNREEGTFQPLTPFEPTLLNEVKINA